MSGKTLTTLCTTFAVCLSISVTSPAAARLPLATNGADASTPQSSIAEDVEWLATPGAHSAQKSNYFAYKVKITNGVPK